MKKRMVIAFFATSLTAGASFAADWPLMGPQLYPSAPRMAVEWTGIYFGVNAGYGWAQGSSNTVFGGGAANTTLLIPAGATTPFGLGVPPPKPSRLDRLQRDGLVSGWRLTG